MTASIPSEWNEFDATAASVEGWDLFPGHGDNKQRPFLLERRHLLGVFASDQLAWRYVWTKAEAGSQLHTRALALLKKHSPMEYAEIRKYCLGQEVKHQRFNPKEE